HLKTVDSQGAVTANQYLATVAELLPGGTTFRWDSDDDANFLVPTDGTAGLVQASSDFELCVSPISLITEGASGLLDKYGAQAAKAILGKMPKSGSAASWIDEMAIRADSATAGLDEKILGRQKRWLDKRKLVKLLPQGMIRALSETVDAEIARIDLAFRGETE